MGNLVSEVRIQNWSSKFLLVDFQHSQYSNAKLFKQCFYVRKAQKRNFSDEIFFPLGQRHKLQNVWLVNVSPEEEKGAKIKRGSHETSRENSHSARALSSQVNNNRANGHCSDFACI